MTLAVHFLLTPRNFNGKQLITVDDRRQRRLMHRIKDPGRRSPQPEFWMRAFFLQTSFHHLLKSLGHHKSPTKGLRIVMIYDAA